MKITAAAIQMASEPGAVAANLDRADGLLRQASRDGAELAVLPEMAISGYGLLPDYAPFAEPADGPTIRHLRDRSRSWDMAIACGFVESDGRHLYDSLALCLPDGKVHVYRKRNLVFWERFRFFPGRDEVVADTPFGRVGLAVCADMIYRRVWDGYRDRVDVALIASAWPEFACRDRGRSHWLLGHVGPLSGSIPSRVATDLGIPVVFANQVGPTVTTIPFVGTWITEKLSDRFAGLSCIADGRHGPPVVAGTEESVLLCPITIHPKRGPRLWRSMSPSATEASSSASAPSGSASSPD